MKYLIKSYVKRLINFKNILKLKRDFRFINQKKIIIVGSGPNLDKSIFNNQENIIVSCNASAGNVYRSNLGDVKLTIVDNELIDKKIAFEKDVRSNIIKNNVLKGINLGHLISVQSNHSKDLDYTLLKGNIDSFTKINKNMRKIIIDSVLGTSIVDKDNNSLISTGVFSICLCLFFGARQVVFSGFTLFKEKKEHFYEEPEHIETKFLTRNHSLADSVAIGILKMRGFNIEAKDRDFYPLMNNWGVE